MPGSFLVGTDVVDLPPSSDVDGVEDDDEDETYLMIGVFTLLKLMHDGLDVGYVVIDGAAILCMVQQLLLHQDAVVGVTGRCNKADAVFARCNTARR